MSSVAVIILTFNEEMHIERCIKSVLSYVDDIIVVDSYSNDETVAIAKGLGANIYLNPWKNYASQFNWALNNISIKSDWIMRLDADEYVENPAGLFRQLDSIPESVSGVNVTRKYYFLGKWIRFGGMFPLYHMRIWRNGKAKIEERWMDEHAVLYGGQEVNVKYSIIDNNNNSIQWWINKHNSYATREMIDIINLKYKFLESDSLIQEGGKSQAFIKRIIKEKIYSNLPLFIRPTFYFFYRYIFKLGFLDGTVGFGFHFMQGYWYRMLVDLKILEAKLWLSSENDPEKVRIILKNKTGLDI